jgi:hypothetical protein
MLGGWPRRGRRLLYVLAFVIVTAITLTMLVESEPYEAARQFAASDARVLRVTGAQASNSLALLKGFRYAFGDRTGEANFTFQVSAERGRFHVRVDLEKRAGQWMVVSSQAISEAGDVTDVVSPS